MFKLAAGDEVRLFNSGNSTDNLHWQKKLNPKNVFYTVAAFFMLLRFFNPLYMLMEIYGVG